MVKRIFFLMALFSSVSLLWTENLALALPLIEPSASPPGGLAPANTPQIVLLTFDDSVTTNMLALVQRVLTNHFNPNTNAIKATFFVSLDSKFDGSALQRLYANGHEIAVHTMSHRTTTNSDTIRWHQEISGDKRTICELAQIPAEAIVGFRAPFLLMNDQAFSVLANRDFLYDSSFAEDLSSNSITPNAMIWPYTLHNGIQQKAPKERIPTNSYPSLFEIPIWDHFTNNAFCAVMDPPSAFSAEQVEALWKTNFLDHYNGNRAPFGLFLHATTDDQWLSNPSNSNWRVDTLNAFIAWALDHPDTWFVTCRDLITFMRNPVTSSEASTNTLFLTDTHAYFPSNAISTCTYPLSHTFTVCGNCLPAAPTYSNAFLGLVPLAGGNALLTTYSQDVTYAYCALVISNTTEKVIHNWETTFQLSNGTINAFYDAKWSQTGTWVHAAAQQYNKVIPPGGAKSLDIRILLTSNLFNSTAIQIAPYELGPSDIVIRPNGFHTKGIEWTDNAHEYSVEWSTNLAAQTWTEVTNKLFHPAFTNDFADGSAPTLFYRVKGLIY